VAATDGGRRSEDRGSRDGRGRRGSRIVEPGSWSLDRGAWIEELGSWSSDASPSGSRIEDRGSRGEGRGSWNLELGAWSLELGASELICIPIDGMKIEDRGARGVELGSGSLAPGARNLLRLPIKKRTGIEGGGASNLEHCIQGLEPCRLLAIQLQAPSSKIQDPSSRSPSTWLSDPPSPLAPHCESRLDLSTLLRFRSQAAPRLAPAPAPNSRNKFMIGAMPQNGSPEVRSRCSS
jgi:hypothetical protein